MQLYDIIPENLFQSLVSANREVYLDALFVLREYYQQELMIRREDLVARFIGSLEDRMLAMQLEEDEDAEDFAQSGQNLSGRAHFLVRKFLKTGWLEREYYSQSFEEFVTVPDYAIRILNLFYELVNDKPKEYNSLVYSSYAALRTADQERDDYMYDALYQAYLKTEELKDSLKSLLNNIRRYHQKLQEQVEVQKVLAEHFDQYKVLITDRIYHPLKTFDSVPRFRPRIVAILRSWQEVPGKSKDLGEPGQPPVIERLVDQLLHKGFSGSRFEAREEILRMIGAITDTYEHVDLLLREIDKKNSTYTRASLERMQYLLNTDRDAKGKLVEVLKSLPKFTSLQPSPLLDRMQEGLGLGRLGYLSPDSLWREPAGRRKHEPRPLVLPPPPDREEMEGELADFQKRLGQAYSHQQVIRFLLRQLADKEEVTSGQLRLEQVEDFIRLLLAVIKHDEKGVPYRIEFQDGYVVVDGYRIPGMRIRRRSDGGVGRGVDPAFGQR